ncbi:MAG: LysM peptidoglycan-binding domain-containing protein [Burkholderiales bacterium]|nr:LysM peptidoglycan-binding domain-containing protein [Burkholderiales bacterium]
MAAESRRVSYRVRKGDTLPSIAKRLGTSQKAIVANNRLKGTKVHAGQTLVVNVPVKNRQTASTTPVKASTKFYVVRPGDTVFSIARRFDVGADDLRHANGMKDNHLQVGQRLSISKDGKPIKTAVVLEKLPASVQKRVDKRPLATVKSYTVRKGDTLFSIASSANLSVNQLKKLNSISGNSVKPGQKLKLR